MQEVTMNGTTYRIPNALAQNIIELDSAIINRPDWADYLVNIETSSGADFWFQSHPDPRLARSEFAFFLDFVDKRIVEKIK